MPGTGEPDRTGTLPFAVTGGDQLTVQIALPPRWQLSRPLGAGGQAEVWLAHDRELDEWVALKIFRGDVSETQRERMKREVRLGRSLSHPNLVRIYELIEAGEHVAVAMEWVREGSLGAQLAEGPLPIGRVIAAADEVLSVLAYLHGQGIAHRDVKPSNLLLDDRGRLRLADLGLALPLEEGSDLTTTAMTVGTPGYMSPEQIRGAELGPASDLYSLGATLFHLLTGRMAFEGISGFEVADRHLHETPSNPRELRPECPTWLARFVLRLLEKSPRDRWPDAARALDALRRRRVFASPRLRRRAGFAVAAAAVLAVAGTFASRVLRRVPAAVRIAGNAVVVSDRSGAELWRRDVPGEWPTAVVGDFFGGSGPQVVVGAGAYGRPAREPDLIVFSADGREVERESSVGEAFRTYFPDFSDRVRGCVPMAIDLDGDDRPEIVWTTAHFLWYPMVLGAWNPRAGTPPGPLLLNSGTIHSVEGADLDGDGLRELVVLCMNNPIGWQYSVAIVKPGRPQRGGYPAAFSPDLAAGWEGALRVGMRSMEAYTPLGSASGGLSVVSAGPAGVVLDVAGRTLKLDRYGNPSDSPLYGHGAGARTAVWDDLSAACLDIEAGRVDPGAAIASFRDSHPLALQEKPMRLATTLLLVRSLARAGWQAAAVAQLGAGLREFPGDPDLLLRLAEQLAVGGDRRGAAAVFERACNVHVAGRGPLDAVTSGGELASLQGDEAGFARALNVWALLSVGNKDELIREAQAFWAFCRGSWADGALDPGPGSPMLAVTAVLRAWAQLERGAAPGTVAHEAERLSADPETRDAARLLHAAALIRGGRAAEARWPAEQGLAELTPRARVGVEALCLLALAERVNGDVAAALGDPEGARRHWAAAARQAPSTWFGRVPARAR